MKNILLLSLFLMFSASSFAHFPVTKKIITENVSAAETTIAETIITPVTPLANGGKSQLTALLLCIFLGGIGIHRFYLGNTWQGIVQLLTFGVFGIWTLIDFVLLCTGDLGPGW
tara:strand:+ start:329 stop:670 length:342 start_codon:yes stop_codon:yes gene_type:complete